MGILSGVRDLLVLSVCMCACAARQWQRWDCLDMLVDCLDVTVGPALCIINSARVVSILACLGPMREAVRTLPCVMQIVWASGVGGRRLQERLVHICTSRSHTPPRRFHS